MKTAVEKEMRRSVLTYRRNIAQPRRRRGSRRYETICSRFSWLLFSAYSEFSAVFSFRSEIWAAGGDAGGTEPGCRRYREGCVCRNGKTKKENRIYKINKIE